MSTGPVTWELRETAISCGYDPSSLGLPSARRRTAQAGLGREVVVPAYLRRVVAGSPVWVGLPVRLAPGRPVTALGIHAELGHRGQLWRALHLAGGTPGAVTSEGGWTRVLAAGSRSAGEPTVVVLRDTDWLLLRDALAAQHRDPTAPRDAPVERVDARHLGRLDGLDGTSGDGWWGRLALEVAVTRLPDRFADTALLRWTACWGRAGFGAGSAGRATGAGDEQTLSDLAQRRFTVDGRPYRVKTLPDWEREEAAHDLGLSPAALLAWPVVPLPELVRRFDDRAPAPGVGGSAASRGSVGSVGAVGSVRASADGPQDAVDRLSPGPQDAR